MMWKKLCITLCAVCFAALAAVPCAFADDSSADSSATSDASSDSSFLGDAGEYTTKDDFPKFIKEAISFIPLSFWWAFQFAIILGFVNALYRRMS